MLLFLTLVACSSGGSEHGSPSHSFRVSQENGVTVAETLGGPKYLEPLFQFEEALRLIQDESRLETLIFRAWDYRLADDGYYYVVDSGECRIKVFDNKGEFQRAFGGKGEGPGEFDEPLLRWIKDGYFVIDDDNQLRLSLWQTDGTLLEMYPNKTGHFSIWDMWLTPDRQVVIGSRRTDRDAPGGPVIRHNAAVMTPKGDTLAIVEAPVLQSSGPVNFGPSIDVQYYRDSGILCYHSAEPELHWYDLDGKLRQVIKLGLEAEPVTNEDRQTVLRRMRERLESITDPRFKASYERSIENVQFAGTKSYWTEIYIDDSGYHWLRKHPTYDASLDEYQTESFRVLSPDGEYLGDATLPEGMVSICQDRVLTIQQDEETGGQDFIVYRIIPIIAGMEFPGY